MRSWRRVGIWLAIPVLVGIFVLDRFVLVWHGVGHFDQTVVIETDKRIRQVTYGDCGECQGDRLHQVIEAGEGARLGEQPAHPLGENRFVAHVMFTSTGSPLGPTTSSHSSHLAVAVEFDDGTWAGDVVLIPPGRGKEPVVIHVPEVPR